jgi:hypothetical protein
MGVTEFRGPCRQPSAAKAHPARLEACVMPAGTVRVVIELEGDGRRAHLTMSPEAAEVFAQDFEAAVEAARGVAP